MNQPPPTPPLEPRVARQARRIASLAGATLLALSSIFGARILPAQTAALPDHLPSESRRAVLPDGWTRKPLNGFDALYREDDPAAAKEARFHAAAARAAIDRVADSFPRAFSGRIALAIFTDPREFAKETGIVEPTTPAAARGEPPTIYINAGPMGALDIPERNRVYAHEYTHVFVGRHVRARLPLWLDEGIAQLVAGEAADELALAAARLFGNLPRLSHMVSRFPDKGSTRSLAYAMSRSVVGYLAREKHPIEGVRGLLRELSDKEHGPSLIDFYSTLVVMDNIQAGWESNLGFWMILLRVVSDETVQWILLSGLSIVAYVVVKVKRRRRLAAMEVPPPGPRPSTFDVWDGPVWRPEISSPSPMDSVASGATGSDPVEQSPEGGRETRSTSAG